MGENSDVMGKNSDVVFKPGYPGFVSIPNRDIKTGYGIIRGTKFLEPGSEGISAGVRRISDGVRGY